MKLSRYDVPKYLLDNMFLIKTLLETTNLVIAYFEVLRLLNSECLNMMLLVSKTNMNKTVCLNQPPSKPNPTLRLTVTY